MSDREACGVCRARAPAPTPAPLLHCWDCAQLLCRVCFTHLHRRHVADLDGTLVASCHVHHVVCMALDHSRCARDHGVNAWFVHLPLLMLQNASQHVELLDDARCSMVCVRSAS
jgi:hypothetical protein